MKTTIHLIWLLLAVVAGTLPSRAATNVWRGGVFSTAWSEPNNWDPAVVPQNGDTLIFRDLPLGASGTTANDLTNLVVATLMFDGAQAYQLQGNPLNVSRGIFLTDENTSDIQIHCGLFLTQNISIGVSFYSGGDLNVSGRIDLNGRTLRVSPESDGSVTLSGVISGSGVLALGPGSPTFGFGTVKLSGPAANTFAGQVRLSSVRSDGFVAFPDHIIGAHLELDKQSGPAVPGMLLIDTNSQVTLKRPHQIADNSAVSIRAGGRLVLEGNADSIGSLDLSGDSNGAWVYGYNETLVDTGGATLSVEGTIAASHRFTNNMPIIRGQLGLPPGSHVIHTAGSQDVGLKIEAQIIGDGGFTKAGTNGLILQGNNSFNGDAVLQEGSVHVSHANALGSPSGATILYGGELYLNGVAIGLETLFVDRSAARVTELGASLNALGVSSWAGPVELNTNLVVSGGSMTFFGAVSGRAGFYLFNAGTHLEGSEANTYEGTTFVFSPLLELNKPFGVRALGSKLEVHAGGGGNLGEVRWQQDYQSIGVEVTLFTDAFINLNGHRDDFGPVTFNGGAISTGTGELGIYGLVTVNPSSASALISGRLGLPPGPHEFRVSDGAAFPDLRIDATVLGAGSLRKTGAGQMWLTTANTYQGVTTVAEGALSVLDPNGLGAATAGTTVNEGGTLEVNFAGTMPEPLAIRGAGFAGNGALGVFGEVTLRTPFPAIYAAIDLTTSATIGVAPDSQLTVNGTISGIGHLTKVGPGTLWFAGNDHNTYSGETFINEGRFIMGKPTGTTAVPGPLSIGSAAGLNAFAAHVASYQILGNIFVNRNGLLSLNGQVENVDHLWLSEGGDVQTSPPGVLFLKSGGSIQVVPGAVGDSATIGGILDMDVGAHVINVGSSSALSGPNLEITAPISSSLGAVTLQKDGPGTLWLTANNTYGGTTVVNEGVLRVDGWQQQGTVRVNAAGTLQGAGVVGNIRFSGNGGMVAPGASPGMLGCNSFNIGSSGGGILEIELNGPSPGSSYDQLTVGGFGQIDLSGITLRAKASFAGAVNQQFVIISNLGDPPVQGAFNGLPENASLTLGDQLFRISYAGGDGNDVVLTKTADVFRPTLTIERTAPSSVRLLWPAGFDGYTLQFTTNLSLLNWLPTLPLPVATGTNNIVTNTTSPGPKFYRLFKP